jgi:hypothetical protein
VGTLNKQRKGIPDEIKSEKGRPVGDYQILYEVGGKLTLHSWLVAGKKKGNNSISNL